jgi:uncharacterized protein (TIGR00251 family)
MSWFEVKEGCLIIHVRAVPRAAQDGIAGIMGGTALKVRVQAPPVEGRANACLVKFLAKKWNIPRADIEIMAGESGRNKRLRIANPSDELMKELLSINPC